MNQDKLKLITLLPGLYSARELINTQIKEIEDEFKSLQNNLSLSAQISNNQRKAWASYTPEQRAARVLAAKQGRRKQLRLQKGKSND